MKLRTVLLLVGLPLGLVTLGFYIPNASAQTNSWISSGIGFWQDATSWSLGLAPGSTQSALITNMGNNTILIDSSTTGGYPGTMTVSDLILAGQGGAGNTLLVDSIGTNTPLHILNSFIVNPGAELLAVNSALLVDNAAGGAVDVEGTTGLSGTNILSGGLYVGFATNATASVSAIDGMTVFTNGYVTVGFYGSAQLTLLGGTLQTEDDPSLPIGVSLGSSGTVSNEWTTTNNFSLFNGLFVGFGPGSQGTLSIPGGTLLVPEHLSFGEDTGSSGQLSLNGGQLIATNNYLMTIGGNATGQVVVSSGQLVASYLIVGDAAGSSGTLTIAGGTVNIWGAMVLGQGQGLSQSPTSSVIQAQTATGSVFITGGQLTVTNQGVSVSGFGTGQLPLTIGDFGVGQMTLSNGSLLAQSVIVGNCENSQGTLTIAGGTASVASTLTAGAHGYIGTATNANGSGVIEVTGGTLTVTNQSGTGLLALGPLGNGSLVQNGGLVQVDQITIASGIASNILSSGPRTNIYVTVGLGQATISNGTLLAQSASVGVGSPGTLTIAGGMVSLSSNLSVGLASNAIGVVQISGGNLYATNQSGTAQLVVGLAGFGSFAQSGGVVTVDQLLVTNGTVNVVSNLVVQPLWAPVTNGTYSTFSLGSGVFNTGATMVSNALPFFVGDGIDSATYHLLGGIHTFANGVEVRSNAVLSGCGTVNANVVVDDGGAIVADCGGTLTFTGVVTNNGSWTALNGTVLESYGPVVNNGLINALNGSTNFHAGFVNNGTVVDQNDLPKIISVSPIGNNLQIQFTTITNLTHILEYTSNLVTGAWASLTNLTGTGGNMSVTDSGALNQTQRFYRVHLVVPND